MEKVFIVECDWDYGEGREHEIVGVYSDVNLANNAMRQSFEADKSDSVFSLYFDEEGSLSSDAEEDGISFEEREDHISIYEDYSPYFIEYNITEYPINGVDAY